MKAITLLRVVDGLPAKGAHGLPGAARRRP